jgi:predicted ATPase
MLIESLRLKNFKSFKDVIFNDIPGFCVLIGANGSGKSSFFQVFEFLKDAMKNDISTALNHLGGSKGINEIRNRNSYGPIEIEIKFRQEEKIPAITYKLCINDKHGSPYVEKELFICHKGKTSKPWQFLNFSNGKGEVVINEKDNVDKLDDLKREKQKLKSKDILAIKGLSLYKKFPIFKYFGNQIENCHFSNIHIAKARCESNIGISEHLSSQGDNLAEVAFYIYENHNKIFTKIIEKLKKRVPDIFNVQSEVTQSGKIFLKFQDNFFIEPFLTNNVSEGTIKIFAYLLLLNDPNPYPLLCIEGPEIQLYPSFLGELAEEFRLYSLKRSQVIVSTYSPDFLNAIELDEVFWLYKKDGCTIVKKASEDTQIAEYIKNGDHMGYLWSEGSFKNIDPA